MSKQLQPPRPAPHEVRGGRWLHFAAIATWLVCGLPPIGQLADADVSGAAATVFVTAYLAFGAALLTLLYLPERCRGGQLIPLAMLLVESIAGMTVIYVSGHYLGGTGATAATIVIVAAQLPYIVSATWAWACVGVQTVVMSALFWWSSPLDEVISLALAIGGFQAFATGSSLLALSEAAARHRLAVAHGELQQAQARLAESSRAEERLRISRDLHDTLGHHLTALSLQLDVASRLSEGKPADHIRQAHAITRLLLSDVRDVVGRLRETRALDLGPEIRALADTPSGIAIHLDLPPMLVMPDSDRAQALLRCVQEIITNATRHAGARNLWIRVEARADGITLQARDDGRGVSQLSPGHGLTGMRERFAALAGSVEFESHPATGFEVRGFMPNPHPAA